MTIQQNSEGMDIYITLASLRDFFLRTNTQRDLFENGQGWDTKLGLLMRRSYSLNDLSNQPEHIDNIISGSIVPIVSLNGHEDYSVKVRLPYAHPLKMLFVKPDEVWGNVLKGLDGASVYHTYFNDKGKLVREELGSLTHYDRMPIGMTGFTGTNLDRGYYG